MKVIYAFMLFIGGNHELFEDDKRGIDKGKSAS